MKFKDLKIKKAFFNILIHYSNFAPKFPKSSGNYRPKKIIFEKIKTVLKKRRIFG